MKTVYSVAKKDRTFHRSTKLIDLTGMKFGRLTVLKRSPRQGRTVWWECVCECGVWKEVRGLNLRVGGTKSCGCLNWDTIHGIEHGMTGTPEYNCWNGIKDRCFRRGNSHWMQYGGRGITVCQRWLDNFENFYADMGPRPKGYSIERIDVNGNYEPSNCKWIPAIEQPRNKTTSRRITAFGREQLLVDWARELNMDVSQLHYHLKRKTMEQIIEWWTKPIEKICDFCGESFQTIKDDQRFCKRKCMEGERNKRRLAEKREDKGEMFMVVKGEGDYKRYLRAAVGAKEGYRWIISKMWAGLYTEKEATTLAETMEGGAAIEKKGVFVRKEEYPDWKLENRKRNPTFWKPQNIPEQLILALQ